jgi:hypothetical protein
MPLSGQTNQTQNERSLPKKTFKPTIKNTGITVMQNCKVNGALGQTISLGEAAR